MVLDKNRYTWHLSKRSFSAYLAQCGFDVYNVDLRGHGRSFVFDGRHPQALDEYIQEDLPACVSEIQKIGAHKKIFLIGHSMGGLVSYCAGATALKHAVRGIVTLGSPYSFGKGAFLMKSLAFLLNLIRMTGILDSPIHLPFSLLGAHLHKRRKLWDHPWFPIRAWRSGNIEDEILEEYLRLAFDQTTIAIACDILAGGDRVALRSHEGRLDYGVALEALHTPLLVITGSYDNIVSPESAKAGYDQSGSREKTFRIFPAGHADILIGREATVTSWPLIRNWLMRYC